MRPAFERVTDGFAHLKKGETVMGERTGPAAGAAAQNPENAFENISCMRLAFCEIPFYGILELQLTLGVLMPRYLSQHTLACLTRQGAETLAQRMQGGGPACAERVLVNMVEGKMFAEFRSDSRETLEAWLKTEGMHFDWIVRIEWETCEGKLEIAG